MALLDDYGGFSLTRSIDEKSGTTETVNERIRNIETQFSKNIERITLINRNIVRWIRTDGAGEYTGRHLL